MRPALAAIVALAAAVAGVAGGLYLARLGHPCFALVVLGITLALLWRSSARY